jgi:hypothetical protein
MSSDVPRIYADFNKWAGDGKSHWLILTCRGTWNDLARLHIEPQEGMSAVFYMDDANDAGEPDDLEADGRFHFDSSLNCWVGIVDWNAIRPASDRKQ